MKKGVRTDMNNSKRGVGGLLLMIALTFGITALTSITAQAQYRTDRYRNGDYRQDRDGRLERERREQERRARAEAYRRNNTYGTYGNDGNYGYNNAYRNQGYQYGVNTGASDAQRGQSYSPQRSRYWRNASSQAFRDGFVQGYDAGYRQYNGSYGRSRNGNILGRIFGLP